MQEPRESEIPDSGSHFAVQKNIFRLQISVNYRNIDAPVKILDRAIDVDGDTQSMMEMKKIAPQPPKEVFSGFACIRISRNLSRKRIRIRRDISGIRMAPDQRNLCQPMD